MLTDIAKEDIRFVRMKDDDVDDIAECVLDEDMMRREDLLLYRSNSRCCCLSFFLRVVLTTNSNFTQPESSNVGIIIRDALSLHRFVNYLINYSIHR